MKREFITELLPEIDKDVLDKIMAEHGKSMTAAQTEAADLKERLKTAQETLKSFDGVDVNDLKGQIAKLSGDLTAKDTEWQGKLSEMQFSGALEKAIMGAKAKNSKAVMALLDVDALKASKNLDADIATALESVKKDNDYLFDGGQTITTARPHSAPPSGLSGVEAAFFARNPALKTNE